MRLERARGALPLEVLLLVGVLAAGGVAALSYARGLRLAQSEREALATLARVRGALDAFNPPAGFPLSEPFLRHALESDRVLASGGRFLEDGSWLRGGYLFRALSVGSEEADGSKRFALAAWPLQHGTTGNAAFLVSPEGTCRETRNGRGRYDGPRKGPAAGAADPADRKGRLGVDGEEWAEIPRSQK
jgi:hypothetical protein